MEGLSHIVGLEELFLLRLIKTLPIYTSTSF
jgi:hypothetical protein